jgi:diacylglycerol kinase family enzyme
MRVLLMVNPRSGRGRALATAAQLEHELHALGARCTHASVDLAPAQLHELGSNADSLVVVGGDGTVRWAAALAADSAVPLAIMPMGTENLAAREFGFGTDPAALARGIVRGRVRRMDMGSINSSPFLVMASVGFDADVVHAVNRARSGPITRWAYVAPAVRLAPGWRAPQMQVTVDGQRIFDGRGQLVVANCRHYGAGLNPARRADAADGVLDIVILPAQGSVHVAWWMGRLRQKGWDGQGAVAARAAQVHAEFDRDVLLQTDGDPVAAPPVRQASVVLRPNVLAMVDMRP